MKVRLADIAREANVSLSAVSLALQGKPGVSAQTAERVKKIAEELGWSAPKKPDQASNYVFFVKLIKHGNILNQDHVPFISDYVDGLMEEGRNQLRGVVVTSFDLADIGIDAVISRLNASGAAGAIILATELDEGDIARFGPLSIPFVFLDAYYEHLPFSFFDMNNADAVDSIVRYLYGAGHRRMGLVQGASLSPNFLLREAAFRESLGRLRLSFQESDRFLVGSRFADARADMGRALGLGRTDLPTALFCVNDIIALGAMRALAEAGIAVPEQVSVTGFDDLGASSMSSPPLTTIRVPKRQIARCALRTLAQMIDRRGSAAEKTLVTGELVVRGSVTGLKTDAGEDDPE
jgi:LacI family transcriptional regulator